MKGVSSLDEFGSLDTVTDRVLSTEANKDGFYSIKLIEKSSSMKRNVHDGDTNDDKGVVFYTIDYEVSTSRGDKRIISSVAIHNKKLYIFNITAKPVKYASEEQWSDEQQKLKLMADSFVVF